MKKVIGIICALLLLTSVSFADGQVFKQIQEPLDAEGNVVMSALKVANEEAKQLNEGAILTGVEIESDTNEEIIQQSGEITFIYEVPVSTESNSNKLIYVSISSENNSIESVDILKIRSKDDENSILKRKLNLRQQEVLAYYNYALETIGKDELSKATDISINLGIEKKEVECTIAYTNVEGLVKEMTFLINRNQMNNEDLGVILGVDTFEGPYKETYMAAVERIILNQWVSPESGLTVGIANNENLIFVCNEDGSKRWFFAFNAIFLDGNKEVMHFADVSLVENKPVVYSDFGFYLTDTGLGFVNFSDPENPVFMLLNKDEENSNITIKGEHSINELHFPINEQNPMNQDDLNEVIEVVKRDLSVGMSEKLSMIFANVWIDQEENVEYIIDFNDITGSIRLKKASGELVYEHKFNDLHIDLENNQISFDLIEIPFSDHHQMTMTKKEVMTITFTEEGILVKEEGNDDQQLLFLKK